MTRVRFPGRRGGRESLVDAGALTTGTALAGIAAYVFVALGTRTLGAETFAPVSVLWSLWAALAAIISFPVQHWIIRTVTREGGDEGPVRQASGTLVTTTVVLALVFGSGAWLLRTTLFHRQDWVFPVLVAAVPLGSTVIGVTRGLLAARGRFVATGTVIAAENLARVLIGAFVLLLIPTSGAYGAALVGGFAVVVLWPSALWPDNGAGSMASSTSPLSLLAGVAGGSLISQVVLTSGPIVLALIGGAERSITAFFAALALFRAPYLVALGVSTKVTSVLTGYIIRGGDLRPLRIGLAVSGPTVALIAAGLGAILGPAMLRLLFGPETVLPAIELAWIAAANGLALVNLMALLLLIVLGRSGWATAVWSLGLVLGAGALFVPGADPVRAVIIALNVAEIVAFVGSLIACGGQAPEGSRPGSHSSTTTARPVP